MNKDDLERLATEQANPRTKDLDLLSTVEMLGVINEEDRRVPEAVAAVLPKLAAAVDAATACLERGGRLLYFGAGTSGRLGVLDASECPPTFGVSPELIQGHIAGGPSALTTAAEGAEDDAALGRDDVDRAGVTAEDFVLVITASGRTPYCLGALDRAAEIGATLAALVCNRDTPCHRKTSLVIDPVVGEEVLSGSTRLKSGTAQKLVLNALSTGVMIRSGRTYGNLMVGVIPSNAKLRRRAARLVEAIVGPQDDVDALLEACGGDVRTACVAAKHGLAPQAAEAHLERSKGALRRALETAPER